MATTGKLAGQSTDVVGTLSSMKSRRRHKRVRKKKSRLGLILLGAAAFVVAMLILSITAFYSGRYEILDKVSPPARVEE